jgi:hypothetical protein
VRGNVKITAAGTSSSWFLRCRSYWKHNGATELLLRALHGFHPWRSNFAGARVSVLRENPR